MNLSMSDFARSTLQPTPPQTRTQDLVDVLHGIEIRDPYRWLENADDDEVQRWVEAQHAYTRSILDPLPMRDRLRTRLTELARIGVIGVPQVGGNLYFHTRRQGTQNQPILYVREGIDGADRVLLDVNSLSTDATVALDWYYPSHDGKYVAYGTSERGSEISTLRVIDTSSAALLSDSVERTRAASLAWKRDNSGFYYTRYPQPGSVPAGEEVYHRRVFYHELGSDSASDPLIFGEQIGPQDWPNIALSEDDRWLTITVEQGWAKSEVFLLDLHAEESQPLRITDGKDFLYSAFVYRNTLYLTTNEDAPRFKLLAAPADAPTRNNWRELIAQSEPVLTGVSVFGGRLVASFDQIATNRLRVFELDGTPVRDIALPTLGSIAGVAGEHDNEHLFFTFTSFTFPITAYTHDISSGETRIWKQLANDVDAQQYQAEQVFYRSKDGTRIPMFIVSKQGTQRDGTAPTLLTGYGGFNISNSPYFSPAIFTWIENGGIYAVANLRGGSEYGEEWHRAGMLANKQNVFDDFIAAAEFLMSERYTSREHLGIYGGSNGGLLIGATITQRPDLCKAAVCAVPLLDMLRYHMFQIAKLWIPEYGSADDPEQFRYIHAYSPYHHVKAGVKYPATMFITGDTDTRVHPLHTKKMAALLQTEAANGSSRTKPILLRIEPRAGHGAGKPVSKQIEESVDTFSFLMWQLGLEMRA
jgi:prolyl oligopeptidase